MRFLIILLFISKICFSQETIKGTEYSHFQLKTKNDIIDFVIADTTLTEIKPILLFCQGSQPVPLFIRGEENEIYPIALSNFDLDVLKKNFHVVTISMPHTPLIVGFENLNSSYCYITDSSQQYSYSIDYLKADFAENYIKRANKVLSFLRKQKWVNPSETCVLDILKVLESQLGLLQQINM